MKEKHTALSGILCFALASFVLVNQAIADGTEQLGTPSIPIATGSYILVEGTGLVNQPSDIAIEIPVDVSIAQVLLYWTGWAGEDDTIQVNGMDVTGPLIGGVDNSTYRADITDLSSAEDLLVPGQMNVLSVEGLDFTSVNNGAALVIILNDGTINDLQIKDGSDFAYLGWNEQAEPVDISITPSTDPQLGTMYLIVSDIEVPRPAAVEVTVGGVTTQINDVFLDNEGDFLDVVKLEVPVPAGATNITVQPVSIDDDTNLDPASLCWHFVSWVIPEPYTPPQVCTYTQGFWKNHIEDWPRGALHLYTVREAMTLLRTPPKKGNAYIILAHQYIAAKLNVANGASSPHEVDHALQTAKRILSYYMDQGTIPKRSPHRNLAIATANVLDAYNNGLIGPGHCDSTCDKDYTPQSDEKEECENSQQNNKKNRSKRK